MKYDTSNTIVINLVGGPCSGKSTTAAGLFALMKLKTNKKVEIVTEVIKDYVYDNNTEAMNDQVLITAQQNHRLKRLLGKVDFIISDASLLNGVVYDKFYNNEKSVSTKLSSELYDFYNNDVFLLPRKPEYDQYGRTQTLDEAKHIDQIFISTLHDLDIDYLDLAGYDHDKIPMKILEFLASVYKFDINP